MPFKAGFQVWAFVQVRSQQHWIDDGSGRRPAWQKALKHVPLAKRGRESTLEQKFARFGKVLIAAPTISFEMEGQRRADQVGNPGA